MISNGISEPAHLNNPENLSEGAYPAENLQKLVHSFFGFHEDPFNNTPDPDFFYMSQGHREALLNMLFGVYQRKGFIVVSGEIGAGKTTLCRHLLRQLPASCKTAVVFNPEVSTTCLLASIVKDFGIKCSRRSKGDYFQALDRFLIDGLPSKQNACIIIDEAQWLKPRALEQLRLLTNLETTKQKLLQIILIGQPELKDMLKHKDLTQVRQRIGVYSHLNGLTLEETKSYIRHRLEKAGKQESTLNFEDEMIAHIHGLSRGIPRLINILCDRALLAAFSKETRQITLQLKEAVDEMAFVCEG
ncbi:MAG: AAA family ATPase [Candidatus Omnitrophica bacterium]|nr:AAA family ATPase [Candidatus Omnitrophota bacterium]